MKDRSRRMAMQAQRNPAGSLTQREVEAKELDLAKAMLAQLLTEFKGYPWGVVVDFAGGIATIKIGPLMLASHCWCIHLNSVAGWPDMQKVLRKAGGELLERFRLDRLGFGYENFQDARKLALTSHGQKMPE